MPLLVDRQSQALGSPRQSIVEMHGQLMQVVWALSVLLAMENSGACSSTGTIDGSDLDHSTISCAPLLGPWSEGRTCCHSDGNTCSPMTTSRHPASHRYARLKTDDRCVYKKNIDFIPAPGAPPSKNMDTAGPDECCAKCASDPDCVVANFDVAESRRLLRPL